MNDKLEGKLDVNLLPSEATRRGAPTVPDHQLLRRIGRGSYGEVWLARNVMGTFRAVKVLYRDEFTEPHPYEREFAGLQKFEPLSRTNEGFVDILQIGRDDEKGFFYYVMELADEVLTRGGSEPADNPVSGECEPGNVESAPTRPPQTRSAMVEAQIDPLTYVPKTLSKHLAQSGRLPLEECLDLGLTLNLALGHLHHAGLLHRDIKPANIIFVGGVPKLADIGLVVPVAEARSFVGTEGYIPPEGPNSIQADLYSLGKVIYEASMGKDRQDFPEPFTNIAEASDSDALLELNAVILKACAANRTERYQSAEEMNADLALVKSGQSVRRKHATEQHLAKLKKFSLVGMTVTVLTVLGLLWQVHQTRQLRQLAGEKEGLLRDSRQSLARRDVANGMRLMEQNDYSEALLWFSHAYDLDKADATEEQAHRLRFGSMLKRMPKLVHVFEHGEGVVDCQFSPDGERLVSASKDHTARVWNLRTGEPITPPLKHNDTVMTASFSPDGRLVVTASLDHTAKIWDANSGALITSFLQQTGWVTSASFDREGKRVLTADSEGTAWIWDPFSGAPLLTPLPLPKANHAMAQFSPDGRRIATAAGRIARIWDAQTGLPVTPELVHDLIIWCLAFSPDGRSVATGEGGDPQDASTGSFKTSANIWDTATGERLFQPLRHTGNIRSLGFSPDGRQLATGAIGDVQLWSTVNGDPVGFPLKLGTEVWDVSFSPDGGQLVASDSDGFAQAWDVLTGELVTPRLRHSGWVMKSAFSPDGRFIATASDDHTIKVWNLATIQDDELVLQHPGGYPDWVLSASFSPDGQRVLTACFDGVARIWDAHSGRLLEPQIRHGKHLGLAAFSPDGKKIVTAAGERGGNGGEEKEPYALDARLWDAQTGKEITPPLKHDYFVSLAAFSKDSQRVITIGHGARVWDATTGVLLSGPLTHQGLLLLSAEFSPDGRYVATAAYDTTAQIWDAATGQKVCPPMKHQAPVAIATYSPDGKKLLTVNFDQAGRIWDARTGQPLTPLFKHGGTLYLGAWSPDNKRVITAGGGGCKVWDAATGELTLPPLEHGNEQVGFSPKGQFILTANHDGSVRVWSSASGELILSKSAHVQRLNSASFSPDSRRILTCSDDGTARIQNLASSDLEPARMIDLAEVLSSSKLDPAGKVVPLDPGVLVTNWIALHRHNPGLFQATQDQVRAWYERQMNRSLASSSSASALFYLDRLLTLSPDDTRLTNIRSEILAHQVQARDPRAAPNLIDLTEYYNTALSPFPTNPSARVDFSELPSGLQTRAGTEFDIRGIVKVYDGHEKGKSWRWPRLVSGIKVKQRCHKLHFLHGAERIVIDGLADAIDGVRLGTYVIHYADGQQREIPIIYGYDLRDCLMGGTADEARNAQVAWQGSSATARSLKGYLRLYKRTWDNPVPEVEIKSIDFVAVPALAQPFLVAITAE